MDKTERLLRTLETFIGKHCPSNDTIADLSGLTLTEVSKHFTQLINSGKIVVPSRNSCNRVIHMKSGSTLGTERKDECAVSFQDRDSRAIIHGSEALLRAIKSTGRGHVSERDTRLEKPLPRLMRVGYRPVWAS